VPGNALSASRNRCSKRYADTRSRRTRNVGHAGSEWHDGGWVFAQPTGRPIDPRADHAEWKALLEEPGVRDARLHDARHTARHDDACFQGRVVCDHGGDGVGCGVGGQTVRPRATEVVVGIAGQVENLLWKDTQETPRWRLPLPRTSVRPPPCLTNSGPCFRPQNRRAAARTTTVQAACWRPSEQGSMRRKPRRGGLLLLRRPPRFYWSKTLDRVGMTGFEPATLDLIRVLIDQGSSHRNGLWAARSPLSVIVVCGPLLASCGIYDVRSATARRSRTRTGSIFCRFRWTSAMVHPHSVLPAELANVNGQCGRSFIVTCHPIWGVGGADDLESILAAWWSSRRPRASRSRRDGAATSSKSGGYLNQACGRVMG
jgi:hypothetical protein